MTDYTGMGITNEIAERFREEGRREILREVARLKPDDYAGEEGDCNFCHAHIRHGGPHKPRCLWLRAKSPKQASEMSNE